MAMIIRRCCLCGDANVAHEHTLSRLIPPLTHVSRYYCESCWGVLLHWLRGEVELHEAQHAPDDQP